MIAMSMFAHESVSTSAVMPSSVSLNHLSHLDAADAAAAAARCCSTAAAADSGEFTLSSRELRSVRQRSVDSSLSTDSPRTDQSQRSYRASCRPSIDSMLSAGPEHSVGSEVFISSQRSVDSVLSGGVVVPGCHTSQFDDSLHDVFSESMSSRFSQNTSMEQPPPLPPKTSLVSHSMFLCVILSAGLSQGLSGLGQCLTG